MRFSSLVVCSVLLICLPLPAQHASSASSGSHSNSSSSSGSSSHSSLPSSPGVRSTTASEPSQVASAPNGPAGKTTTGVAQQEKRSAFSFFRHPWRTPEPKPAPNLLLFRGPVCKHRPCLLPCPGGTYANSKGGCIIRPVNSCPVGTIWSGSNCAMLSQFLLNDCSGLALMVEQQARRAELAQGQRESICALDPASPECTDLAANSQSEAFRYRELRRQYELCQRRGFFSLAGAYYPFATYYPFSNLFDAYLEVLRDP